MESASERKAQASPGDAATGEIVDAESDAVGADRAWQERVRPRRGNGHPPEIRHARRGSGQLIGRARPGEERGIH